MAEVSKLNMNTGATIPQLGFGLWRNPNAQECKNSVKWALEAGYTHFDEAQAYQNEEYLGQAIQEAGVDRSSLFITTKIATDNMWWTDVIPSFEESLKKLQTHYVDLLLLHFPVTQNRGMSWRRMEQLYASGQARAIGVSNYTIKHLQEMEQMFDIQPAVNQVEMSVVLQQPELVEYCTAKGIIVEAYTPLAEGIFFDDPTLKAIADKHGKSVPQVMLRWCLDNGVVCLTKSARQERIKENLDIFDFQLDEEDMQQLKLLDQNYRTNWDPTNIP